MVNTIFMQLKLLKFYNALLSGTIFVLFSFMVTNTFYGNIGV